MSKIIEIIVPQENVNDEFAKIIKWKIPSGKKILKGDEIVDLETSKALFEIEAEKDGYLFYEIVEGTKVKVGQVIAYLCEDNIKPAILTVLLKNKKDEKTITELQISLKAKKLMNEFNITESDLAGFSGQIKENDIRTIINQKKTEKENSNIQNESITKSIIPINRTKFVELSLAKQYEIQQLTESCSKTLPSNISIPINFDKAKGKIVSLINPGIGTITFGELVVYEIGKLLKQYPMLNAFYENGVARIYNEINIGIAMNLGKGLKVPVIKNVDQLELKSVSTNMSNYALKYLRDELKVNDIKDGTFTVTDLSSKGITYFTPIINNYQSAVLGICSQYPGTSFCNIIVSFDHRLTDGMEVAEILSELKDSLENLV